MHLLTLGLNHHTAPVEIREKLAIAEASQPEALAWLLYQQVPFASGRESRSAVAIGPAVREASLAELMSRRDCVHAYGGLTLPDVAA